MAAQAPEAKTSDGTAADRLTAHQRRLLGHQRAYCRALARANRALTYEDCEEVFADTLSGDALTLPASLSPRDAHLWFSRRLQQRAIDFIRHRDGRRDSEKERRLRLVSLDAPAGRDDSSGFAASIPDPSADVAATIEADEDSKQAVAAAGLALSKLKPLEQRLLKLRYELPDASLAELAAMLGLTADQANYRLRTATQKFKQALAAGRMGPDCDVARVTLRMGRASAEAWVWARAEAHLAGCWMCRAWALQHAALAWLPFPAFTKLEWLVARFEAKWRPFAPVPETAAGAGAAGGAALAGGAGTKLAAFCVSAVTATVCAGVVGVFESGPPALPREPAAEAQAPEPNPTPAKTATPLAAPRATRTPESSRARNTRRRSRASDTREAEEARPAVAPAGNEFEPTSGGSNAPVPPAPAPVTGGTEFTP